MWQPSDSVGRSSGVATNSSATRYARFRRRRGGNVALGGLGRAVSTLHEYAHATQVHDMTRARGWCFTSASLVHTPLAPHLEQADLTGRCYSERCFSAASLRMSSPIPPGAEGQQAATPIGGKAMKSSSRPWNEVRCA